MPPDTDVAKGPSHVDEVVNTPVAFLEKLEGFNRFEQDLADFFAPAESSVGRQEFFFDHVATHDEPAQPLTVAVL